MESQQGGPNESGARSRGGESPELAANRLDAYRIEVGDDALVSVGSELAKYVQGLVGGRRIHKSTAYRWVLEGVRGRRLPAVRVGGRLYTSPGAFSWWSRMLAQDLLRDVDGTGGGSAGEPLRESDVVDVLRRAGIKG